jgi:hypothetical protein
LLKNQKNLVLNQQKDWITNELAKLTLNRRKVLTGLAYQPTRFFQGQEFSISVGLPPSSINKSVVDLRKADMIYQDQSGYYRVPDPAVAYFIRQYGLR